MDSNFFQCSFESIWTQQGWDTGTDWERREKNIYTIKKEDQSKNLHSEKKVFSPISDRKVEQFFLIRERSFLQKHQCGNRIDFYTCLSSIKIKFMEIFQFFKIKKQTNKKKSTVLSICIIISSIPSFHNNLMNINL